MSPSTVDSMRMGYMFEDIIRRFSENEEAGSHYTPREVIALMVNLLLMEADEELFVDTKEIKVLDMAAGEDVIIVTRGKNTVFNGVLKLPQSHKTTNWCVA